MKNHIVRIHCKDQKGLVYKVMESLYQADFNVTNNAEHVDHDLGQFFMRTEIEGALQAESLRKALLNKLPADAVVEIQPAGKKRLVVLVTKEAHCIGDLLIRCAFGEMDATIEAVIGNHQTLEELVKKFHIPFHGIPAENLSREEHEERVIPTIQNYAPDYVVLAKYMRILTPGFVQAFPNKIINIHHSFLPAFVGAKPYQQAYERGVKIVGATAHFVNDKLDEGPIIAQNVIPVTHGDSAMDMASLGRDVEKITLARALRQVIEDRVFVYANKTVIFE